MSHAVTLSVTDPGVLAAAPPRDSATHLPQHPIGVLLEAEGEGV